MGVNAEVLWSSTAPVCTDGHAVSRIIRRWQNADLNTPSASCVVSFGIPLQARCIRQSCSRPWSRDAYTADSQLMMRLSQTPADCVDRPSGLSSDARRFRDTCGAKPRLIKMIKLSGQAEWPS